MGDGVEVDKKGKEEEKDDGGKDTLDCKIPNKLGSKLCNEF